MNGLDFGIGQALGRIDQTLTNMQDRNDKAFSEVRTKADALSGDVAEIKALLKERADQGPIGRLWSLMLRDGKSLLQIVGLLVLLLLTLAGQVNMAEIKAYFGIGGK